MLIVAEVTLELFSCDVMWICGWLESASSKCFLVLSMLNDHCIHISVESLMSCGWLSWLLVGFPLQIRYLCVFAMHVVIVTAAQWMPSSAAEVGLRRRFWSLRYVQNVGCSATIRSVKHQPTFSFCVGVGVQLVEWWEDCCGAAELG